MKKNFYFYLLCCSIFLLLLGANYQKISATQSFEINAVSYEFKKSSTYDLDDANIVESMTFGQKQLGHLTISGDITQESTFRNTVAYGIKDNISFSYSYDGSFQSGNKKEWNITSDSGKKVNGISLSGSIAKGALIVQKSFEGDVWTTVGNPIVNFYENNKSGMANFYTTAGEDVSQGVYYRVIFAYQTRKYLKTTGIWPFREDEYSYKKHVELYAFYVAYDTATLSLHNLSVSEENFEGEEYEIALLKRGETLQDGDTTIGGFSIDKLGSSFYVSSSKNNEGKIEVEHGDEITENGRYLIESTTKLGTSKTYIIYVFNGGEDKGYSTYFNESIIDGKRIFRYNDYPTYAKNASLKIKEISEFVPILQGTITNVTTNETITIEKTRQQQTYALSTGTYEAVFYSGNIESGAFYKYTFRFIITDEESKPFVNKDNLNKTYRVMDYTPKHYEVAYQTTLGGYIFVCFSLDSYEEAYKYAYEIEKRFIESTDDGLYYKSIDNPNLKVKYFDYIAMTEVLNYYASKNVEVNYFNLLDEFTYRTYNDDLLGNLESLSIKESIKVFPNKEEQEKIINRQMFINGFEFVSVADYDSIKVEAYCYKNGVTYTLEYNKDISQQLVISSKYKIIETNKYGDTTEYDVYYIIDNQTISKWEISINDTSSIIDVSSNMLTENKIEVSVDSIILKNIQNLLDPLAIVTIKAPGVYSFEIKCYIDELSGIALYKKGRYELSFIDRVGTFYKFIINISGDTRYNELINETTSNISYSHVYNKVYLNKITLDEEIIYSVKDLKDAIDRVVNRDLYTNTSYQAYMVVLQEAIELYKSQDTTQKDINEITVKLNRAYESLVLTADRTKLHQKLDLFEATQSSLYTQRSFLEYQKAYNYAKQVYLLDDPSETGVAEAIEALDDAYNNLAIKGDRSILKPKLNEAQAIDCSKYTPASIEALSKVYDEVFALYLNDDLSQTEINESLTKLTNVLNDLILVADFTKLYEVLLQAQQIVLTDYTKSTRVIFKEAYDKAVEVYKNFNNEQSKVDLVKTNLLNAISNLILSGNFTQLQATLNSIKEIKEGLYTKNSITPLKDKYQLALIAIEERENQVVIDSLNADLLALVAALEIRESKRQLYDKLMNAHSIDLSKYSETKAKAFETIYQESLSVFDSSEATDEEINQAIENIEKAEKKLNEKPSKSIPDWLIVLVIIVVIALIILFIWWLSECY